MGTSNGAIYAEIPERPVPWMVGLATDGKPMTVQELLDQLADVDLRAVIIIRPFERKADEPLLARCDIREIQETRRGEILIDVEEC